MLIREPGHKKKKLSRSGGVAPADEHQFRAVRVDGEVDHARMDGRRFEPHRVTGNGRVDGLRARRDDECALAARRGPGDEESETDTGGEGPPPT